MAESTDTALVIQRLSLIPEGDTENALQRVDEFVIAVQDYNDGSEHFITEAEELTVDSQTAAQIADVIQDELKGEVRDWDQKRLAVTRPILDLKSYLDGLPKPGTTNRQKAIAIRQQKISDFRRKVRDAELAAQREAERQLAAERERLEAAARKEEERAAKLKTEAARQRAAEEAARLREQAEMTPTSVAVATSGPTLAASTTAEVWEGTIPLCDPCRAADAKRPDPKRECPHNKKLALQWILSKFDEWGGVITFKPAGLNDVARKYKDTLTIPGIQISPRESFRSKAKR